MHAVGTACLIGGNLAITAKHVVEDALKKFGSRQGPNGTEVCGYSLKLLQVLPGPTYNIWNVFTVWTCGTDIAILHLGPDRSSAPYATVDWKAPVLRIIPPPTGQKVVAFGYRESKIQITEGADGTHHIEINDAGTMSAGEIGQVFAERRDSSMLTFPCFEVRARFAPGMSGGLVVDEDGSLCGIICSSFDFQNPNTLPLSYAATLWPMLTTVISADRGDSYPRGVSYPMIDLALNHQITAVGLEYLDPKFFPGRTLPRPV